MKNATDFGQSSNSERCAHLTWYDTEQLPENVEARGLFSKLTEGWIHSIQIHSASGQTINNQWIINRLRLLTDYCLGFSYLPSSWLVLDIISGPDLGANVLQIRCRGVAGIRASISTWCCWLLLYLAWNLLGHRGFSDDSAALSGVGVTVCGGSRSSRCGGGGWAGASYRKIKP